MVGAILRDLRFAARGLRRNPGFAATAILTLALGIGATTAVFSVVYGVLFRPLPFPSADRLVQVVQILPPRAEDAQPTRAGLTPDQVTDWRATTQTLDAIGYYGFTSANLTDGAAPARLSGATVSVSLFRALGVAPFRGRLFVEDDAQPGAEPVVILGHRLWVTTFGASDGILDTLITLNGRPARVIGVMPAAFGFPSMASPSMSLNSVGELDSAPEFWMPIAARPRPAGPATGGMSLAPTLALIRPGVTIDQAVAEVNTLMPARVGERYAVELVSAGVEQARAIRPVLLLFQGTVLFVLLIACINVIHLLLARTSDRQHELAVRLALGASRSQLASYGMAEGLLIGVAGGALGCFLAYHAVALFRLLPPFLLPRMEDVRVDTVVLATACAISITAGLSVGLAAALRTVRGGRGERWIPWSSRAISPSRSQRPSHALVVTETAASIMLLAGAGLLLASFVRLTDVDRGFDADDLFTFSIALPQERYRGNVAQYTFHDHFAAAVRQLPGVRAAGASTGLLGQWAVGFTLEIEGQRADSAVWYNVVAPGTFETFGIPITGREFTDRDRTQQPAVAIVNETFARRFFPGENPVGRQIRFQEWSGLEIVGVAGDTRMRELDTEVNPEIYLPQDLQTPVFATPLYVVRASNARALLDSIRAAAARLERDAVVFDAMPLDALLARHVITPKFYGVTAAGFAAIAVVLAALGLYGVLAYSIARRTREFGIRIALGATRRAIMTIAMGEAFAMVGVGVLIGLGGALYLSRSLEALLFGVEPHDPATFAAVVAIFAAVAGVACYTPGRRATRVDPVVALRAE